MTTVPEGMAKPPLLATVTAVLGSAVLTPRLVEESAGAVMLASSAPMETDWPVTVAEVGVPAEVVVPQVAQEVQGEEHLEETVQTQRQLMVRVG